MRDILYNFLSKYHKFCRSAHKIMARYSNMKLSLCMIVKNEEDTLPRCLESVKGLFDEIVIVDTGSTDKTASVARTFTPHVFSFEWCDDFSAARNFSFSKATGDYLFWLDADDVLPPASREKFPMLRAMLERDAPDMVFLPYDSGFDEKGEPLMTFRRERVLRRSPLAHWVGRVHECIVPYGRQCSFDLHVHHLSSPKPRGERNLNIYKKWEQEEPLSPRDLFYYGRELYYHRRYDEAVAKLKEMLTSDGWYVNKIEAAKILSACFEAQNQPEKALSALFQSFLYGEPRASVCCEIGRLFQAQRRLEDAVFWYKAALNCRDHTAEGDFELPATRSLTPLLGLVCCYDALGDRTRALEYHKRTEALFPEHPAVVHNRAYFAQNGH